MSKDVFVALFFVHALIVIGALKKDAPRKVRGSNCANLDEELLRRLNESAFEKIPILGLHLSSSNETPSQAQPPRRQCLTLSSSNISDPIEKRALCPWSWRANFDPRRIPAVIMEAQCRCDKFRIALADRQGTSIASAMAEYDCVQLMYRMRVVKFTDENCNEHRTVEEEIPLACVPVRQASSVVNQRGVSITQTIFSIPSDY